MLHEDMNCLNGIIEQQIQLVENTPAGEDRDKAIDSLCKLLNKTNEAWRQYSDEVSTEMKLENDRKRNEAEVEVRTTQNKNDRLRSILDISKTVLSVAAFVTFEVLAHTREVNDIMPRSQEHVKNNPVKLKI